MRDSPDDMTATVVCPACSAETIETLPGGGVAGMPEYRCLRCDHEFDASGEPALADAGSDDTDAL